MASLNEHRNSATSIKSIVKKIRFDLSVCVIPQQHFLLHSRFSFNIRTPSAKVNRSPILVSIELQL